ncbi:MAG: alpha-galactosidase [Victivallales bacterium]|jgi:alpha-galactosidase|nr:alpha-galactosidase [Victivallales bacterium]
MQFKTDLPGVLFNGTFSLELQCNGEWIDAASCQLRGLLFRIEEKEKTTSFQSLRILVTHRGEEAFRLGGIRLVSNPVPGKNVSGRDLKLYLEGWSMPSPCGMRRYGDRDFQYNPEYLKCVVAEPAEYDGERENHFRAEHLIGVQNAVSGDVALIAFLTTADQYGRFQAELSDEGLRLAVIAGFDDRLLETGDIVSTEEIGFFIGNEMNSLLKRAAELWGERMKARTCAKLPIGWCSWYYYFADVTEDDMLENLEFLATHREYPLEYIQLDDGYQPACGDWLKFCEKFPHGLGYWAGEAIKKGFKPALWLAPFLVEKKSELFRKHPEWCIHDRNGNVVFPCNWRGDSPAAVLDGTCPEVQQYFRELFAQLRSMGFSYVKLDFMVYSSIIRDGVLHDPKATRAQAFRRGLAAIREGFGDDGFILGCTAPFGPCVGLVDGERIATDITPYWGKEHYSEAPTVPNVCRNGIQHAYMHRRLFLNDPDTHIARIDNNELTEEEVGLWTAALKINGGMLLLSDRFESLTPERLKYSELLLREPDAYEAEPLDRMERTFPALWHGVSRKDHSDIFGVFNFENEPQELPCPWKPVDYARDIFSDEEVKFPEKIAPHSCIAVTVKG